MKFIKAAVTISLNHSTELDAFHFWGVFCYFFFNRTLMSKTFHSLTYLNTECFQNTFKNIHRCLWYRRSKGQGLELRAVNKTGKYFKDNFKKYFHLHFAVNLCYSMLCYFIFISCWEIYLNSNFTMHISSVEDSEHGMYSMYLN